MARRCRSCLTLAEKGKRNCQACGKRLPAPAKRRPKHRDALELPREAFIEANDGFDGCWVCRELGVSDEGKRLERDHEHRGAGRPRGILCSYHNRLLGPRYTPELVLAYAKYLNREAA